MDWSFKYNVEIIHWLVPTSSQLSPPDIVEAQQKLSWWRAKRKPEMSIGGDGSLLNIYNVYISWSRQSEALKNLNNSIRSHRGWMSFDFVCMHIMDPQVWPIHQSFNSCNESDAWPFDLTVLVEWLLELPKKSDWIRSVPCLESESAWLPRKTQGPGLQVCSEQNTSNRTDGWSQVCNGFRLLIDLSIWDMNACTIAYMALI